DRAGIGLHDAIDDLHQRRLAGAVLAEHRVDFARQDGEVDAVVGDDRGIDLGDSLELETGRRALAPGRCVHVPIMPRLRRAQARFNRTVRAAARTLSRSRNWSSCAATATAIAPGALLRMPATPIGQVMRESSERDTPSAARRRSN